MPLSPETFTTRAARLKADMAAQCLRVQFVVESAVESAFDADRDRAASLATQDDEIDRVDVAIEKAAVALLVDVASNPVSLPERDLRLILTIVKVNNEAERIADLAVNIAQCAGTFADLNTRPPETFRVMANSVIGIVDAARRCFEHTDVAIAKVVLASEDAVERFKRQLTRDTEERLANRSVTIDEGFSLLTIAGELERIADHATNIAEQVIYAATGAIVRHEAQGWVESQPG